MASSTIQFKYQNNVGKKYTENLYANSSVINAAVDSDTFVAVDNFCRGLAGLTTNTYLGDPAIATVVNLSDVEGE